MAIIYDSNTQTFHLKSIKTSYVLQIMKGGYLAHLYWGKKVEVYQHSNEVRFRDRSFSPNPDPSEPFFSLDTLPQEYPAYGNTDFRVPAIQIQLENGSTVTNLKYNSHQIVKGKPALDGLPSTYVEKKHEAETLMITLLDELTGLYVILSYTTFEEMDVITRSSKLVNTGEEQLKILKVASVNVDFQESDFELLTLPGAWARERHLERSALRSGLQVIESRRGASSHQINPFLALTKKETTEQFGEVYAFNLVYSGNFQGSVEVDQFRQTRVTMGINPFDFSWLLEPGEAFQAPEVVMVYSANGLGEMSRSFHSLYQARLCRGRFRDQTRPVLINNWEATYFDFNEEKIVEIARQGKELGVELFVLDDGWFGKRNSDKGSLGDWLVDVNKLPKGLSHLVNQITKIDMQFGLWFEPEMVSVDSDLYRAHPDWCIHVPNRSRSEGRNQLILDLSRPEVCDEIVKRISTILESAPITYVKWDMNRHMTEIGSKSLPKERQRETAHRYMLGLYRVMDEITTRFPAILFESCSGGGGRFDPGILHYMPQTWTSDNTDAISRLKIQYGTSLVYPMSAMGSHVSAVPNHQVQRMTSMEIRGHVAMSGNFGYELDVTQLSEVDKDMMKKQIAFYKEVRPVIQFGNFYRLLSPFTSNDTAWMYVSKDQSEAVLGYFSVLAEPNAPYRKVKLTGLDPRKKYKVNVLNQSYYGDELMNVGINIPFLEGDFVSVMWRLKVV
ncbi:alpha-galactosidase [Alkalihalobacillus alcalophilus ATCC 27647 = CGMCC 1.3604]|uniref:Alpha-galactosidase n=1 Tax=Alkalihalobacillus alcalophilus ATCC 27647 = CGMCC 1.3604 TaxID=1218173 RepID=A0A094WJ58_ALKAL|nr:alpha-galactosidase [Alkalihalobacillus alcalophilus]KGA97809.1 alpha-galactosidase [Alkalihalobacillus alcalophilus ATCC 27647 = CGMCC 1.3604]MED1563794.1 alpha-galactosidase [Alkalihalobacillus alcalophilus]THG89721.1 alpha-galactosidase [Alkalihalobacillus alcalophilus ATCC 27647 = CGMCC 1.3604]